VASTFELMLLAQTAQLAVPVNATAAATVSNGTATSGTTETFDTVLGAYQCQLISGRRYLAVVNGLVGNGSVAGDVYNCNIRNSGSSSNPTSSSTLIAQLQWVVTAAGTTGRSPIPLMLSFIAPTTGTNTFMFSAVRNSGTGVFTPIGLRELYVMYLGAV
jgi:hypothetical protein